MSLIVLLPQPLPQSLPSLGIRSQHSTFQPLHRYLQPTQQANRAGCLIVLCFSGEILVLALKENLADPVTCTRLTEVWPILLSAADECPHQRLGTAPSSR